MIFTNRSISPGEIIRTFGRRFREYRMTLDLTRQQVADQTCLSMTTLYKLETGQMTDMSMQTMLKLLRVVGLYENWDKLLPATGCRRGENHVSLNQSPLDHLVPSRLHLV